MHESERDRLREEARRDFMRGERKYRKAMQEMKEARHRHEYPGAAACFPARTMVHTPSGLRDIADLSGGDTVLALSSDGTVSRRSILRVRKHNRRRIDAIGMSTGAMLRTTSGHSFSLGGRWTRAADLKCSDEILGVDGRGAVLPVKVASIEIGVAFEPVFNLIVDEDFTFLVNGIVAHSFSYWRRPRMAWWRLRAGISAFAQNTGSRLTGACS